VIYVRKNVILIVSLFFVGLVFLNLIFSTDIRETKPIYVNGEITQYNVLSIEGMQYIPLDVINDFAAVNADDKNVSIRTNTKYSTMQEVAKSVESIVRIYSCGTFTGSGIVIDKGLIATCGHVAQYTKTLDLAFQGDTIKSTQNKSVDGLDLSLIKFPYKNQKAVTLGDTSLLKAGDKVIYIGNLGQDFNMMSEGYICGFPEMDGHDYIRTNVVVHPGNSGGGIFNMDGELIGLLTFGEENGLNLSLSVDEILKYK